jgi:hypothetical protein
MRNKNLLRTMSVFVLIAVLAAFPFSASANHSWGGYHWARTSNPFTVKLGDNVSSKWDSILSTTSSDWSKSTVLDTRVVTGHDAGKTRRCPATAGMVEVCNDTYGNNGWLGVASIWATGGHITQGTVKLNDTYFNTSTYNTTAWRNLVSCQEVGHTFGLDHQDENFSNSNLGTCMDYTNNPGTNQHPNQGDYDQLLCIYDPASANRTLSTTTHSCRGTGHNDSSTTIGAAPAGFANADLHAIENWGEKVSDNGKTAVFVRDFGNGYNIITFVIWASE